MSEPIATDELVEAGAVAASTTFDGQFPALFRAAYRAAFRLNNSREDAADCAQEACTRAYARWKKLSSQGDVTPWVVRVASNLAIDRWRRSQRALRTTTAGIASFPDDRVDLARALAALPRRQREVVVLRYIADMSEVDVAGTLQCSVGSVKKHAARGLDKLRAALGDEDKELL